MSFFAAPPSYEFEGNLPVYYPAMLSASASPVMSFEANDGDVSVWRAAAHSKLMELAGPFPASCPFSPEEVCHEQREGYVARKILINLSPWNRVGVYLLTPDDISRARPAVVLLHDHGSHFSIGKEKVVSPLCASDSVRHDAALWAERCYDGIFVGDELARRGYVVLALDAPYFGERGAMEGSRYVDQQAIASNLLLMGYSWAGMTLHNDLRAVDFLMTLPYVDSARIAALGFSFGAYRAWMLAAASQRLAAVASVCWMSSVRQLVEKGNNLMRGQTSYSMYIPRLAHYLDFPDVAAIAVPTPAMYIQGANDKLFNEQSVMSAFNTIRHAYQGSDKLTLHYDQDGHVFSKERQTLVFDFFDKHLLNGK